LDQQLDQVIDTDLMVGLPQQRGADWVSALRNLGSIDVTSRCLRRLMRVSKCVPKRLCRQRILAKQFSKHREDRSR
jgi:hypothetical protein